MTAAQDAHAILTRLGVSNATFDPAGLPTRSPVDGSVGDSVRMSGATEIEAALKSAASAFNTWRRVPAPRRGELVRLLGEDRRDGGYRDRW